MTLFMFGPKGNTVSWCFGDSLKVLNPPGPITGLFSYPGSGNTWLRLDPFSKQKNQSSQFRNKKDIL